MQHNFTVLQIFYRFEQNYFSQSPFLRVYHTTAGTSTPPGSGFPYLHQTSPTYSLGAPARAVEPLRLLMTLTQIVIKKSLHAVV